jgi:hypothetical protein
MLCDLINCFMICPTLFCRLYSMFYCSAILNVVTLNTIDIIILLFCDIVYISYSLVYRISNNR